MSEATTIVLLYDVHNMGQNYYSYQMLYWNSLYDVYKFIYPKSLGYPKLQELHHNRHGKLIQPADTIYRAIDIRQLAYGQSCKYLLNRTLRRPRMLLGDRDLNYY